MRLDRRGGRSVGAALPEDGRISSRFTCAAYGRHQRKTARSAETKAKTARFWAYLGDSQHPYVVYDFTESRKRDGPQTFLANFEGYLKADAYGGYDGIYAGGQVVEVACWAHARRKWNEARTTDPARAHHALALIQKLYRLERDCRRASDEERLKVRQERSLPILAEFKTWLDEQHEKVLPKSPIGQAATYTVNQWTAFQRYCESGESKIDNNAAERVMRPCV